MNSQLYLLVFIGVFLFTGCKHRENTNSKAEAQEISEEDQKLELRNVPDSLKTIEINGEILHYTEKGEGETLVFLHGSISDYRVWQGYFKPYSKDYRTVVYSRRYAWPNRQVYDSLADYSVQIHADDLYQLIQKMELGKVHLVGHSYGAFTALTFAVDHPELVRSMVLGEPPALFLANNSESYTKDLNAFMENHFRPAAKEFKAGNTEKGLEYFVGGANGNPEFDISTIPESQKKGWMANILELKGQAIAERVLELDQKAISGLEMPVLMFVGDQSPKWLTSLSVELHRLLPNSQLDTLINSAHGLYFQQPEQSKKAMREFYGMQ